MSMYFLISDICLNTMNSRIIYNYLPRIYTSLILDLSPEHLECVINRRSLQHRILDLVIHRNELRHGFQHLVQ